MKTTSLILCVCLTCAGTTGATEFYVSPNGTPGGNGTSALPWDLQTALTQPSSVVRPGDIIWLRGGVYTRNKLWSIYRSTLAGTAAQPIFVLQYPRERATIEGSLFQWQGGWVVYRGFELRNSYPHRYTPQPASHPTSFVTYLNGEEVDLNVSGVDLRAPSIRLENLVIHDHIGGGIGVNVDAPGTVVSGCLSYYNGWQAEDRAHGHGMYGQMAEPGTLTVKGCAFYGNYALGFQSYGANDHLTDNVRLEGNTLFFNGILARQHQQNLLIGPNSGLARNPVVSSNCVYDLYGRSSDSFLGYVGGMVNPVITGNYFQTSVMFSENRDGMVLRNNTFLDRLLVFGPEPYPTFDTAAFPDNSYLASPPLNNYVHVTVDNSFLRALVTVYNWEDASTVTLSFPGLRMADYEVRNAQDFYAEPVATFFNHPYNDPPQLPLTGLTVAKPVSAAAPQSAAPAFATFVVIEKGILGPPRLPNSAPEISPIPAQAFPWNTQSGEIQFTVADAETPAGELAVFATSSNPSLLLPRKIVFGGAGENRSLTLSPEPGAFGSTIVRIAVTDGLDTRLTEFQVDVTHPNQPPQISAVPPVTLEEDQVSPPIAFVIGDAETPADSLGLNVISSDTALLPIAGIGLGGSGVNRTVTLTPAPGQVGTATVTIEVTDGEATTSTHFDVTVTPKTVADLTLGLMAWWKLDEATGASFVDASGFGNTASLVSGYYWAPTPCHIPGKIGPGALHLNGTDKYGSGDHLALNSYPPLNLGVSSFTLALWMRTTSTADSVLLNKYSSAGMESGYLLAVDGASNGGKPRLRISSGSGARTFKGTRKLNDGAWHHLAVVVSREDSSTSFFVDGVLAGSSASNNAGNLNTTAKFTVGKAGYYGGWWQGDMDEVRVYGRALSPAEVALLLESGPNTPPTITSIAGQQVMQDTVSGPIPFTVGDAETPAIGLVVTAESSDETLLPAAGIVLSGTGADRTLTLQPAAGRYGNANVTVTVSDGPLQASTQFSVQVLRANSAPWISAIANQTLQQATASDWIPFTVGDADTAADALEVTVSSSNMELLPQWGITIGGRFFGISLGGAGEDRTIKLMPRPEDGITTGTAIITLQVSDGQASTSASFQVTVVPSGLPDLSEGLLMRHSFDHSDPCNGNPCVLVTGYYTFPPTPPHVPDRFGYEFPYAALYLNGTDRYGGGDYLTTESAAQGSVGSGSFTLSLWVMTRCTKDSVILNKYSSAGMESGYLLAMDGASNGGKPRLRISSGTGARTFKGTGKLNDGAWHHLAVVVDRENSRVSFYVDGVASGATAGNTSGNLDGTAKFSIGKSSYTGTWWQGAVDELRVYSRVLSDIELAWLAADGPHH